MTSLTSSSEIYSKKTKGSDHLEDGILFFLVEIATTLRDDIAQNMVTTDCTFKDYLDTLSIQIKD
jgi:hypothetical protein